MPFLPDQAEVAKYRRAYTRSNYRMKQERLVDSTGLLASLPCRGSYLDVGCGKRDMLQVALGLGFLPVHGTEIVPELCDGETVVETWIQDLAFADKSFDVVSCFDVLEHLQFGDIDTAILQLTRVAKQHVLVSVANNSSQPIKGEELHLTLWPFEVWDSRFRRLLPDAKIMMDVRERRYVGQAWRIDLC